MRTSILLVLALLLTACSSQDGPSQPDDAPHLAHSRHHHHHGGCSHGSSPNHSAEGKTVFPTTALALTFFSGFASTLGGVFVVCLGVPTPRTLAHLLSFATGIMLYISYADLLSHAVEHIDKAEGGHGHQGHDHDDHGHSHGSGHLYANLCMLLGMLFWGAIALFIPHSAGEDMGHSHGLQVVGEDEVSSAASSSIARSTSVAKKRARSPGPTSARGATPARSSSPGSSGKLSSRRRTDTPQPPQPALSSAQNRRMIMTGLIAALGVTLHNLPEGIVVYNSTLKGVCIKPPGHYDWDAEEGTWKHYFGLPKDLSNCLGSGAAVTFAIALHNIPEGMAVAAPILAATGSPLQAMKLTVLSSAAEPLAAIVFGYFFQNILEGADKAVFETRLWMVNAGVAGIMIALCLGELLPAAFAAAPPKVRAPSPGAILASLPRMHFL
jgi:ZIP family zinc transporter